MAWLLSPHSKNPSLFPMESSLFQDSFQSAMSTATLQKIPLATGLSVLMLIELNNLTSLSRFSSSSNQNHKSLQIKAYCLPTNTLAPISPKPSQCSRAKSTKHMIFLHTCQCPLTNSSPFNWQLPTTLSSLVSLSTETKNRLYNLTKAYRFFHYQKNQNSPVLHPLKTTWTIWLITVIRL